MFDDISVIIFNILHKMENMLVYLFDFSLVLIDSLDSIPHRLGKLRQYVRLLLELNEKKR